MNALNAVLEPMLMSASKQRQTAITQSALTGIFKVGCTLEKTLENGNPLSLENAHTSREIEAKTLKNDTKMMNMNMKTKTFVAAREPVAW